MCRTELLIMISDNSAQQTPSQCRYIFESGVYALNEKKKYFCIQNHIEIHGSKKLKLKNLQKKITLNI